jgi:hypothetical protein
MKEKAPIMFCKLCGYRCSLDSVNGGRLLKGLEGDSYFLTQKIEDCEARLILNSSPTIPKEVARGLVQKGPKLGE